MKCGMDTPVHYKCLGEMVIITCQVWPWLNKRLGMWGGKTKGFQTNPNFIDLQFNKGNLHDMDLMFLVPRNLQEIDNISSLIPIYWCQMYSWMQRTKYLNGRSVWYLDRITDLMGAFFYGEKSYKRKRYICLYY